MSNLRLLSGSVLVVDDEALVCTLTAENLRELGLTVHIANGAASALELVRAGLKLDLLLTDIRMPDMDGFTLSKKVKELTPDIGVVYMSGYTLPSTFPENAVPGAELVAKPFSVAKIAEVLLRILPEPA